MGKLIIIGNGFDLHHGIQSSYMCFKAFLENENIDLYNMLETYIPLESNKLWSNLEYNLKDFSIDSFIEDTKENASTYLIDYGSGDWRDCYNHDYEYEIDNSLEFYKEKLTKMLKCWIGSVYEKWSYTEKYKLDFDNEAIFINFNYTLVLEDLYAINNVFHIHNSINDEELIFGCSHIDYDYKCEYTPDVRVNECEEKFIGLNHNIEKEFNYDIENLDLENIDYLDILGHSLGKVDWIYFEIIFSKITNIENLKIRISYHNEMDKVNIEQFQNNFKIAEKNIELIKLEDLKKYI